MNDIVVRRLFSAGLALEAVAGLMGDHGAAGKVQEAISELDGRGGNRPALASARIPQPYWQMR
jgi:hypothetical protein